MSYELRKVRRTQSIGADRLKTIFDSYGQETDKMSAEERKVVADRRETVKNDAIADGWKFISTPNGLRAERMILRTQLCLTTHNDSDGGVPETGNEKKKIAFPTKEELLGAIGEAIEHSTDVSRGELAHAMNNGLNIADREEIPMAGKRLDHKTALTNLATLASEFMEWIMADMTRQPAFADYKREAAIGKGEEYLKAWKAGL